MATKYIKCTFETGIVLLANSNSEGRSEVIDFIPGSKFVGVAAKLINQGKLKKLNFTTLHDGSVRFGEATLYKEGQITYKVPLSYFKPKVTKVDDANTLKIYHHHLATDKEQEDYQLQQVRKGYFLTEGKGYYEPKYNYRQKSTHPKEAKLNQEMYGYDAANRSQEWIFAISADNADVLDEIVKAFVEGNHAIGKSKRAEYGKVRLEEIIDFQESIEKLTNPEMTLLYVKSRLALFDPETGEPTFEPTATNLGLKSGTVNWEKTQIRTTTFTPHNSAQQGFTSERIVIEKGSVIALDKVTEKDLEVFDTSIGAYTNEGYGEILFNPAFLEAEHNTFEAIDETKEEQITPLSEYQEGHSFINYLVAKKQREDTSIRLFGLVNKFVLDPENEKLFTNMNSQWSKIRSLTLLPSQENISTRVETYMTHGIEKGQWEGKINKIFNYIENEDITDITGFLQQVAQQMQLLSKKDQAQRGES